MISTIFSGHVAEADLVGEEADRDRDRRGEPLLEHLRAGDDVAGRDGGERRRRTG